MDETRPTRIELTCLVQLKQEPMNTPVIQFLGNRFGIVVLTGMPSSLVAVFIQLDIAVVRRINVLQHIASVGIAFQRLKIAAGIVLDAFMTHTLTFVHEDKTWLPRITIRLHTHDLAAVATSSPFILPH